MATSAFRQIDLLNRQGIEVRVFVDQSQLVSLRGCGDQRVGKGKRACGLDSQRDLKYPFIGPQSYDGQPSGVGHLQFDLLRAQAERLEPALNFHPRGNADGSFAGRVENEG